MTMAERAGSGEVQRPAVQGGTNAEEQMGAAAEPSAPTSRRRLYVLRAALAFVLGARLVVLGLWGHAALASSGPARGAGSASAAPADARGAPPAADAPAAAERPQVRTLLEAVRRRQAELDAREHELAAREERLRVYEQDVTAKIAALEEIEKRLAPRAKAAVAAADASAESLAKIYAAMKPADAAPILEKLDEATVLTIFARMKEKQVGEILPLLSRDKAIGLTQSLALRR